tara:strand:+ start:93 stop:368 length:276 start_codon:yes stop_codon:yes gene_type:complete
MDELIANSIEQKAGVLGRQLSTLTAPERGCCASSGRAGRLWAAGATGRPASQPSSQPPPKSPIPRPLDPPRPLNAEEQEEMAVKVKKLFAL